MPGDGECTRQPRAGGNALSTVVAAAATDVGRVRERNEDAWLVDAERGLCAVADGMGGHAAGDVASRLAIDTVAAAWGGAELSRRVAAYAERGDAEARLRLLAALREAVVAAHRAIVGRGREHRAEAGLGTTFTGFLIAGDDAFFAHSGDSRAYLLRGGRTALLSEDHTVSARLAAAGVDEPGGAGVLTSALGIGEPRIATFVVPACTGDRFVLTSDGAHGYFDDGELGRVAAGAARAERAAQRLVKLALARGGEDNATAVVADVVEGGAAERAESDAAAAAACPLLSPLGERERLRALRVAAPRDVDGDCELPAAVDGERLAYVVVSGDVELGGKPQPPGALLYPGALVAGAAMPAQVARSLSPARLLVLRQADVSELVEDEPDLGVKIYGALARLVARR